MTKKTTSLNFFFFLSQVKGTLSFTSHTSQQSSKTVRNQWNQLGYKQKKPPILWTWKTLLLMPDFWQPGGFEVSFFHLRAHSGPLSCRRGWYSILQAPWQSAQTETWWISGWCLCYRLTSVAAEEAAMRLRWLVFPRDELLKMTQSPPPSSSSALEHILQSHYNSGEQQLCLTFAFDKVWSLLTRNKSIYIRFIYTVYSSRQDSGLPKSKSDSFYLFYMLYTINTSHNIINPPNKFLKCQNKD